MSSSPPYDWRIGESPPLLGEHSIAKHEIFEQYLGIYIERLTRTPSQTMLNLTVVDGFCGGGVYRRWTDPRPKVLRYACFARSSARTRR